MAESKPLASRIARTAYRDAVLVYNKAKDTDLRFLKPENWKVNSYNTLVNTYITFFIGDEIEEFDNAFENEDVNPVTSRIGEGVAEIGNTVLATSIDISETLETVTVFGVNISLSKSPTIIKTNVKGFGYPVTTKYKSDSFDLKITFVENGPYFWQQNADKLTALYKMLDSVESVKIENPQLNLVYDINLINIEDYSIGQDEKFYSRNPIEITAKSASDIDIFSLVNPNEIEPVIEEDDGVDDRFLKL